MLQRCKHQLRILMPYRDRDEVTTSEHAEDLILRWDPWLSR